MLARGTGIMLGIVFSEFIEMVEDKFSADTVDQLTDFAEENFDSEGAYTTIGDYDHNEMLILVSELSKVSGISIQDLIYTYGVQLFKKFHLNYPEFFEGIDNSLLFLSGVETRIHTEVRKLYPNSELPEFDCEFIDGSTLVMLYSSARPFASLAHGLIIGCIEHFNDKVDLQRIDLSADKMTKAKFTLTRAAGEVC